MPDLVPKSAHPDPALPFREPERVPAGRPGAPEPDEQIVDFGALWSRIRRRWRLIAALAAGAALVSVVIAMLLPSWYRASASMLPPSDEDSAFGLSSLLKGIGVPGVKVPTQSEPADVFVAILKSRRINEKIVDRFKLRERYHKRLLVDALRELARHTHFEVTDAGIIAIEAEDRTAQGAAALANAYVDVLDEFNREVRMTKGKRTRVFVGQRLDDISAKLHDAEEAFAQYQATHKTPPLSPDASSALSSIAGMYAQREALQVRLGIIESYTQGGSDEATQIRAELAQLDRRLSQVPETGIESLRLLRELKTLEQLRALLTAQYEQARIDEVHDVSTLERLDVATPPERRARPKRALLVLSGLMLGLGAGVAIALLEREPLRAA